MKSLPVIILTMSLFVILSTVVVFGVTFTDVTQQAHLNNYPTCRASAWLDYNRDGLLDLVIGSEVGTNRLHKNMGDGTFLNVTSTAHIPFRTGVWGINYADIDNDGFEDIYYSTRAPDTFSAGRNILLYNTGLGHFTDISESSYANVPGGGIAACFAPFSKGPWVDLFVPNQYYPDTEFPNLLVNGGNATFSDITTDVGLHTRDWWDVPIAFDYDNDARLELFCTKDYNGNSMYDRPFGYNFIDISDSLHFQTPCGYGATVGDVNNDGWFDLYITNWHDYTDNLFIYDSTHCRYYDRTQSWGAPATTWTSAAHFADFDNDGWLDLFVTGAGTGNTYYRNVGGHSFSNQTGPAGLINTGYNWGASIGDYDNDGFLDIFVPEYVNGNGGKLYHNNGNNNHWVEFELEARYCNRDGIGARLYLESASFTQTRQVIAGSGFGSQNSLVQHFGLGSNNLVNRLTIIWPGGGTDIFDSVAVDAKYHVIQGEALSVNGEPVSLPANFSIVKAYPNPFNSQVQIEINISRDCHLSADIIDILGRKIKSLISEDSGPQTLKLTWDGTDQSGSAASSGVYYCRITDGFNRECAKLTLLK
jgi:hypothetical protein